MAQIDKPNLHFNTKLYTGNGSTQSITGVGFQPDWLWIKCRSNANGSVLFDALRSTNSISSNDNSAQADRSGDGFTSLDSDGFTMNGSGSGGNLNVNGRTYVAWNWKANGQGSSNTDGSINTTYTSANTTAGFSISTYTGTGSSATIGHGLGASPDVVIIKKTSASENWNFQTSAIGYGNYLVLNGTGASASAGGGLVSAVSSTTVTVDSNSYVNSSGATYVMYCFAEKKGYSKFGSYAGNGNDNGTFVYTGFKPAFIMVKRYDGSGLSWRFFDSKRNYNGDREFMYANLTDEEVGGDNMDFLSNYIIRTNINEQRRKKS